MPRAAKGARLYLRKRRGREATWVIRDNSNEVATGCRENDGAQAERALADYIVRKYEVPKGPCDPNQMSIARALEIYGNERAPQLAAPKLVGYHIEPLVAFWGDQPVGAIKGETCRAYVHFRTDPRKGEKKRTVKSGTARRELETLGAAINFCHKEGHLTHVPRVTFPKKTKGKTRWLTRNEAARLLWAARRVPHLRTFILIGLYTGTRSTAILSLQWIASLEGGWIDLDRGILYRGADGRVETNKRQPPCSIPHKLIAHLRRARKRTRRFAVEYDGERVIKLRRSWRSACKSAGLGTDVTPHTLRHTAVTWRLLKAIPLRDVAEYVGMSEKMARETYGHFCPDHLAAARDAI